MKTEELSDLIREAIDKINVQRDWINQAWLYLAKACESLGKDEVSAIKALLDKAPK